MKKVIAKVTVRVVLASLVMMSALPALGQIGQEPVEPAPESASWLAFLLALLFGGLIALGCLMSPKRTHQD
ncbi:MAG: hypothetical protein AB8C95_14415 [Phycisphaeraceae bacterium]